MEDLRASNHYRRAGDLYLRRRTCVGWGRGATHWVDRVGICGRLFFGLIIYTLEFRWYNFESKNRDKSPISRFKFIVTIWNNLYFNNEKSNMRLKIGFFWQWLPKWPLWCQKKNELSIKNGRKNTFGNGHPRRDRVAILSPCPSQ